MSDPDLRIRHWQISDNKNPHLSGFLGYAILIWWRRRELNPRPQVLAF